MPEGWSSESRRVKVAGPDGERWERVTYYTNTMGMEFVRIPPGDFIVGSLRDGANDWSAQRVRIARPFYMGVTEVTNEQFQKFQSRHSSGRQDKTGKNLASARQPVVEVDWFTAKAFCDWLSKKEHIEYTLPSAAEWEYACRAGSNALYWWGDAESSVGKCANVLDTAHPYSHGRFTPFEVDDGYLVSAPVGSFLPNAFGLYDMIGNVLEWCNDASNSGDLRMNRGGAWNQGVSGCRSASRQFSRPSVKSGNLGFRVLAVPPE